MSETNSSPSRLTALFLTALLGLTSCGDAHEQPYHESPTRFRIVRESPFNHIIVERRDNIAELRFRVGDRSMRQTVVDLTDPLRLMLPYYRSMLAGAFAQPQPRRILQIGLGGAALNRFLVRTFPEAEMVTVEIDPEVLAVAEEYMGYHRSDRDRVVIADGRAFVERARGMWDWILVDAYGGGSPPRHLRTREFYALLRDRLAPGGVAVFNLHGTVPWHEADKATLLSAFPHVHLFSSRGAGNVVALAFADGSIGERLAASGRRQHFDMAPPLSSHLHALSGEYRGPAHAAGDIVTDHEPRR